MIFLFLYGNNNKMDDTKGGIKPEEIQRNFIDIDKVIASKSKKLQKLLPRFVVNYLKRITHQDELNNLIQRHIERMGLDFNDAVLNEFGVRIHVHGEHNIPKSNDFIIASNHPLGGLDGMALMNVVGKVNPNVKFIVNDILLNLDSLKPIFIPVNKHGRNTTEVVKLINDTYSSDNLVLMFPAGLCSRKKQGKITDLEWKKSFITKAKKHKRDIIPVFIDGRNSNFFYNLANIRTSFGIRQNIEMLYLVDEMFKQHNKDVNITFGNPISYNTFDSSKNDFKWADIVKQHVYALGEGKPLPLKTYRLK